MTNFNSKCFKCIAEQEKQGVGGGTAGVLFEKMKKAMVGSWWWNFYLWSS